MEQTIQARVQVRDINYLLQKLVEKYDPLQIYCFHKDETSRKVEGCFGDRHDNRYCDYWLLLVMDSKSRIENAIQDFVNAHYEFGKITIIAHSKEGIEKSINDGYKFFVNVCSTGKLLYNKQFIVIIPLEVSFERISKPGKSHSLFQEGISRAEGFLHGATECFENKKYNVSAFMLHQTVEQCCIALIKLHMDYRCDIHNLHRLLMMCRCFAEVPYRLFVSGETADLVAFDKLVKSYSNARYRTDFMIEEWEVELLIGKVIGLLEFSKEMMVS
ncbi:HEPN domain-containing protein [Pedobacter sp. PWIIR3]